MEAKEKARELIHRFGTMMALNLSEDIKKYAMTLNVDDWGKLIVDEAERTHLIGKKFAISYCEGMHEERKRAMDIAYEFSKKAEERYKSIKEAGGPLAEIAFAKKDMAEECRYVGNAIDGRSALAMNNKGYWELVKDEIEKM